MEEAIVKTQALIEGISKAKAAILEACLAHGLSTNRSKKQGTSILPARWRSCRLRDIATIRTGISKSEERKFQRPFVVPYLRVANVQDGYLDLKEIKTITIEETQIDRYRLRKGDVLFNEKGVTLTSLGADASGEVKSILAYTKVTYL